MNRRPGKDYHHYQSWSIMPVFAGVISMIRINEKDYPFAAGQQLRDLAAAWKPEADIFIINGFPCGPETVVEAGDRCWLIKRGEVPAADEMDLLLYARHTPGVQEKVKRARVGIMGLGGLGSVVAVALARIGVGQLLLADFDVVEPSNLNRQQYFIDQIGMPKTEAMKANLARINPYVQVVTSNVELTEKNIPKIFGQVDVLAECFDSARMKAAGLRAVLTEMSGIAYVTASGLAGYGENNLIRTEKLYPDVYLVGDGETAAAPGQGLMAPRVGIAASHQANQVLRILLGVAE